MKRNRSVDDDRPSTTRRPSGAAVMQPTVTDALTRALFAEWASSGYAALSLERVARRAGVGKAALYRRWPSKAAMVSESMANVGLTIIEVPDTGSLRGDVKTLLLAMRRLLRHRTIRRILLDLHAEMARSGDLAALMRPFQQARRSRLDEVLNRAARRGEIPADLDRELAADLVGGPLYWRMAIIGGSTDMATMEALTGLVCGALSLVEHPRGHGAMQAGPANVPSTRTPSLRPTSPLSSGSPTRIA